MLPHFSQGTGLERCNVTRVYEGSVFPVHEIVIVIKFYSHQLMHFFIQLCISLLSYIKIT